MLTALTPVSNTVLHRLTYPPTPHYAVLQSQSSFAHVFIIPSLLHNTKTHHYTTVHLLLCAGLYMLLIAFPKLSTLFYSLLYIPDCISRNFYTVLVTALRWIFYLLVQEGSGRLDVRGFASCHTTRCCCPLSQYNLWTLFLLLVWITHSWSLTEQFWYTQYIYFFENQ